MLFSELYGSYYNTVAKILKAAIQHPMTQQEILQIVQEHAFGESTLNIPQSLGEEHWQLLKKDGSTVINNVPTMPLTTLQKRWINAIANDPRIRLFTDTPVIFEGIDPLFLPEDIDVFDQYADGDPYTDEKYIQIFRTILEAIKNHDTIEISSINRHGNSVISQTIPLYLEYSEKDDKLRMVGTGSRYGTVCNLARIVSCKKITNVQSTQIGNKGYPRPRTVIFELYDERNALERVLMHFAHNKKQVERIEDSKYQVTLYYDKSDETEILIRILSFGPMIKVTKPVSFIELIKERLLQQRNTLMLKEIEDSNC